MAYASSSDIQYLEAEFTRLDIMLRREVRRWVLAGQDPNDDYRGLYVTQAEADSLLDRPFGVSWGQWVALPPDEAVALDKAQSEAAALLTSLAQRCEDAGTAPCLLRAAQAFGLDRTALDILILCTAPAFDTKYERLYGYLQDNVTRRRPSVRLVLDLLGGPGSKKFRLAPYLGDASPLCKYNLVRRLNEPPPANEHWLSQTLHADETLVAWLRGEYAPHGPMRGCVALSSAAPEDADLLLVDDLLPPASGDDSGEPIYALYGVDRDRQDAIARVLAARHGCPLLTVDLNAAITETAAAHAVICAALRDARLTGSLAYLRQWHICVDGDGGVARAILTDLYAHPGPLVLAGERSWQPHGMVRTRAVRWIETGVPTYRLRQRLWCHYLMTVGKGADDSASHHAEFDGALLDSALLDSAVVDSLAAQFVLASGSIRDAVLAARDEASKGAVTAEDLRASARACSNQRLQSLTRKIAPRYTWCDIVLPANQQEILRELVVTIRQRSRVLDGWGVGTKLASSAGVTVLFAGPPGTGKTMAAEVVAGDLGLDLYKIDLSSVVSKYIGETEKNLERIFGEAASSNAILFFDEADAIFGKRSEVKDAHDRYANIEVSYLLQRMEAYDGVTILATNLRANLDEAFMRRLQFVVDFPFPRAEDRRRIWAALFPAELPRAENLDFDMLARKYELAGGSIRNVIVAAAYLAANNGNVVTMEHLLHGVRRELQKMGRMLGEKEFGG